MNKLFDIIVRYLILIVVAFSNLFIFYFIFTPLTIYPIYFLSKIFFNATLISNSLIIGNHLIEISKPCVAGAAYYLLLILNLSTPNIRLNKRIKLLLATFVSFLILNIFRILFLIIILNNYPTAFDFSHKLFWYIGSTIFVVVIWFFYYRKFNIKEIPVYSDLKFLCKKSLIKRKS